MKASFKRLSHLARLRGRTNRCASTPAKCTIHTLSRYLAYAIRRVGSRRIGGYLSSAKPPVASQQMSYLCCDVHEQVYSTRCGPM